MTVSTLRPTSTTSNTGTLTGGATAHGVLADDSDASYVTLTAAPQTTLLGLGDLTLPAGAVIKSVALRSRIAETGAGSPELEATLDPAGSDPNVTGRSGFINWTTPTTVTLVTDSSPDFTDSGIDGATLLLTNARSSGEVRAYEAYVDVTYVALPVPNVTAPTDPVTTTNRPVVIWSNTLDTDGGPQTRYEVRVFTAAQYGAGGFDPDTSSAIDESGIVSSAATTWQGADLLPDDTYRAYVRVAQTVNGVLHWSDWDFIQFDVTVELPAVLSITVTPDTANAKNTIALYGRIADDFSVDQLSSYTFDAGSGTLSVSGGQLVPSSTSQKRFYRNTVALRNSRVVLKYTTDNPLTTPNIGVMIKRIDVDNYLTVRRAATSIEIRHVTAGGASTVLASTAGLAALATSTSYWVLGKINGDDVTGEHWTTDPALGGVAAATVSFTLTGAEKTLFGQDVLGNIGASITPGSTAWRYDDLILRGAATADAFEVQRSTDGGVTWETIRTLLDDGTVTATSGVATTYDYEMRLGEEVDYRARALHNYSGEYAASFWLETAATNNAPSWWLKNPLDPEMNMAVTVLSYDGGTRAARHAVLQPLGAALPIVVSDTRGGAVGTIIFLTESTGERDDLDALQDPVVTLFFHGPASDGEPDRYIRTGDHTRARYQGMPSTAGQRTESVAWVDVDPPDDVVEAWP